MNTKQSQKLIYLLPGTDGVMHGVKADDIDTLIKGQHGGDDSLIARYGAKWLVLAMPAGTIERYFEKIKESSINHAKVLI